MRRQCNSCERREGIGSSRWVFNVLKFPSLNLIDHENGSVRIATRKMSTVRQRLRYTSVHIRTHIYTLLYTRTALVCRLTVIIIITITTVIDRPEYKVRLRGAYNWVFNVLRPTALRR